MTQEVEKNMTGAWTALILGIIYIFSPVDFVPDVVPVAGWIDDLIIGAAGALHFLQNSVADVNTKLSSLIKMVKWILIILGAIAIILLVFASAFIISLFQ